MGKLWIMVDGNQYCSILDPSSLTQRDLSVSVLEKGLAAPVCLYFFKPGTVVFGGAESKMQQRRPCKIVSLGGNLF